MEENTHLECRKQTYGIILRWVHYGTIIADIFIISIINLENLNLYPRQVLIEVNINLLITYYRLRNGNLKTNWLLYDKWLSWLRAICVEYMFACRDIFKTIWSIFSVFCHVNLIWIVRFIRCKMGCREDSKGVIWRIDNSTTNMDNK